MKPGAKYEKNVNTLIEVTGLVDILNLTLRSLRL